MIWWTTPLLVILIKDSKFYLLIFSTIEESPEHKTMEVKSPKIVTFLILGKKQEMIFIIYNY